MKKTLLTLALTAAGIAMTMPAQAQQLRFMTGPQGGSWYPLGGAIQGMAPDGVAIQVLPGGGVANVQGVQNGAADLGFANSISTVDAIKGREPFEGEADNVCNLATLYPQYFQIVTTASTGIEKVEDFAGKRLATQPVGNTAEQVTRAVMQAAGMTYDDLSTVDYVSYSDGVSLMQDNNSDIFTLGTTVPASAIMDLANSSEIKLVPLDADFIAKMKAEINPGYTGVTIPAGSYPGQDEDVSAVGYATHVIARCDLDAGVVEGILGQMWENRQDLAAIAAAMKDITVEEMAQDVGVPMHEGAKAFYKANGVEM
ncbi:MULTISPECIES: TAXI family TRAP transporter solute-binding subunit [Aurantimonas]|uniref:TAXI family TRAP transporter solute-binding subunit n=2 Tax=Aurantimonadaceae TaxID=255475 RepID=UPI000405E82B|nr:MULTISPECIES: TAXI family TRAP transporter solute-binding subunit [Aurantimonas]MAP17821.1 C4-dicarboxylate ABC transporter substrate-binding protein [Aurantimonas sp.]MCW7545750.1 TAXI family TRAP transporter solute-binding subunit [Aurantimonas litoralis]MBC6716626.1 TAXI family TRAP transporter solute-binding subunit [Aurantimonas sp. DM33-3]MCC4298832.1 TAXI family TRAP transporter solute-binding subunit [Aurantimonas coralicida]MCD1643388.1 TAXI family TRAP transporter solute-binding s